MKRVRLEETAPKNTKPSKAGSRPGYVERELGLIKGMLKKMAATQKDIMDALASEKASDDKVVALLEKLAADNKSMAEQLAAAIATNDPAQLQAILDEVNSHTAALEGAATAVSGG